MLLAISGEGGFPASFAGGPGTSEAKLAPSMTDGDVLCNTVSRKAKSASWNNMARKTSADACGEQSSAPEDGPLECLMVWTQRTPQSQT